MAAEQTIDELLELASPYRDAFLRHTGQTITYPGLPEAAPVAGASSGLTLLRVLGVGGMSVVHLARQESVGREVAVKVRSRKQRRASAQRLLQEARLTGSLEHPNVVPLHDVRFEDGEPQVILKRIEGHSWETVLSNPTLIAQLDTQEPLVWHVQVLIAVCRAVEYAHAKGILHRDIKPENVMVGHFGEVTVLDWGIAISTRGDDDGLPQWSPRDGIVGTPAYMAPEMLSKQRPDARLDVYLLGATLARVLGGVPPHSGRTLPEILASITGFSGPDQGPPALRALCASAMALSPDDRIQTAAAFRQALVRYLDDRAHDKLVAAAQAQLAQLQAAVTAGADAEQVYTLLAACRFGFSETLTARPAHGGARQGLDAALTLAARWALAAGRPALAAGYLAEVTAPEPALVATVRQASTAQAATMARAEQLLAASDPVRARQTRALVGAAVWLGSAVVPAFFIGLNGPGSDAPLPMKLVVVVTGALIASALAARPSLVPSTSARTFLILLVLLPPVQSAFEVVASLQGWSTPHSSANVLVMGLLVSLVGTLQLDRRIGLAALVYLLALLTIGWRPEVSMPLVGAANGVMGLACVWVYLSAQRTPALSPATP